MRRITVIANDIETRMQILQFSPVLRRAEKSRSELVDLFKEMEESLKDLKREFESVGDL